MLKEFKAFIMRGNVMDMAVGVVIGSAFSAIVTSLVNDIIMPLVGIATAGVNFSDIVIQLNEETTLNIGNFIQTVIDFLIIAFCIFIVVKAINKMNDTIKKQEEALKKKHGKGEGEEEVKEAEAPKGPTQEELLTEIRDLLKISRFIRK